MPEPTIVLVHGAWADGSSWNPVSVELQSRGFSVLTPPNLLRGGAGDAAYLASFLAQRTTGPVVLVGHSYGGVVITNAGAGGGDVKALVYVNAFIPKIGESVFEILGGSGSALDVPDPDKLAYISQTTLSVDETRAIINRLRERFPNITGPRTDDICYATTNRQQAVQAIAADAELVLVVGSTNSSNSKRLVEVAERAGAPAYLVDDVSEVDLRWLHGVRTVATGAALLAPR